MNTDQQLILQIRETPFLNPGDKEFLLSKVSQMDALERLKLKQTLSAGMAPGILQQLQVMRAKFYEKETPKPPDPITKMVQNLLPQKPKRVLSTSVLSQTAYLGGPIPQAITREQVPVLKSLAEFNHLEQLSQLNAGHVSFELSENAEQILQNFLQSVSQMIDKVDNVGLRRGYFMNFVQSPLFTSYLNTGLTALRHPELEPAEIILNLLYQINTNYLNTRQFQNAAIITHKLRSLCGI